MPEATCAIELFELQAELGFYEGYGRGARFDDVAWVANQQAVIDSCINSGLHKFYFPTILPGETSAHEWSFLKPTATLTLLAGTNAIQLPGEFGGISGECVLATPTGLRMDPLAIVGPSLILRLRALAAQNSAQPRMVAIQPRKGTNLDRGQRFELMVYPDADVDYVIQVGFTLAPNALTVENPWPLGGPVHRETILESCLAVAEARIDNAPTTHRMLFAEQLAASVSHDRKYRPQLLGYNGNRRDNPRDYQYDHRLVTIDGLYS